mgnify:CR=1 FL=1
MQKRYTQIWQLFTAFFRIGLFTFGGGLAMLPMIEREVIDRYGWTDREEILDIYAMSQSVPGVIAANTAIFLGNRLCGVMGAVAALVGVVLPSLIIITTIAIFFNQLKGSSIIASAFAGIRAAVVGLIAAAAVRVGRTAVVSRFALGVCLAAFLLNLSGAVNIIFIIVLAGIAGYVYYRSKEAPSK